MCARGLICVGILCLLSRPTLSTSGDSPNKGLGEAAQKILAGATRVECFRIDPRTTAKADDKPAGKHIDGYPIASTAKEQGREFATKLADVLNDKKSYGPPARCFFPGVGFRAWKDKDSVDVIICYACSNFYTVTRNAEGKEVARTQLAGFGANWAAFVQLAKDAFPDDPAIQKLNTKDSRGVDPKAGL